MKTIRYLQKPRPSLTNYNPLFYSIYYTKDVLHVCYLPHAYLQPSTY